MSENQNDVIATEQSNWFDARFIVDGIPLDILRKQTTAVHATDSAIGGVLHMHIEGDVGGLAASALIYLKGKEFEVEIDNITGDYDPKVTFTERFTGCKITDRHWGRDRAALRSVQYMIDITFNNVSVNLASEKT